MDRLNAEDSLSAQLDKIICEATGLEPWRQAFIDTPEAIEYCQKRAIRRNSERKIYLLKKTQLNGAHAELFTYCLFQNKLLPMASSDNDFHPLKLSDYQVSYVTDDEPGIRFTWCREKHILNFDVEWNGRLFIIIVPISSFEDMPEIYDALCNETGFAGKGSILVRETSPTDFLETLLKVREALSATAN